jgi:hypothetical protein
MVTLSVSVGVMAGFLILIGVVLTALSNTGVGNMLALAYTRIVFSGNVVTVKEIPLPFFFSGVLATRGKRAFILAAIVAFIRIFLLFSVSYAGFRIQPVEYAKQGFERFNQERTIVKFDSLATTAAYYVEEGLFLFRDGELPQCIRWEDNVISVEKRLLERDNTSVRIACSGDKDYDLKGTVAAFELMRENATVEISRKDMRIYSDDAIEEQHVVPWTSSEHSGTDFYILEKGPGSNHSGDTIVCTTSGMAVAYMCDAREFLVFRENITELQPGQLRSTGFGRLRLFDKLNGTECLNIALRISQSAGSVDGPIRVFAMLGRILNDASTTDQQINKFVSVRGRSEMSIDALVLIIVACVLSVLLYVLGYCLVTFAQVLPLNSVGGLSKIYDDDANQRGSSSHPIRHVTLGITESAEENQHFGSCKEGGQVERDPAKFMT